MDILPHDVIEHIGHFLGSKDRYACMLTNKIFGHINFAWRGCKIVCGQETHTKKLTGFDEHIRHLRKVFPRLAKFCFVFENIDGFEYEGTLDIPEGLRICVEINRCKRADAIIGCFPKPLSFLRLNNVGGIETLQGSALPADEVHLYLNDAKHLKLLKDKTFVSNITSLRVSLSPGQELATHEEQTIDLSLVDARTTTDIQIWTSSQSLHIIHPHKLTGLAVWDDEYDAESIEEPNYIYESFASDPKVSESRMQAVLLTYCCPVKSLHADNAYYDLMRILPPATYYFVSPVDSDAFIPFLRSCPAERVGFFCKTQEEHVMSAIINLMYPEDPYPVRYENKNAEYANKTYNFISDALFDLDETTRGKLHWLFQFGMMELCESYCQDIPMSMEWAKRFCPEKAHERVVETLTKVGRKMKMSYGKWLHDSVLFATNETIQEAFRSNYLTE